jgi:hypothetical protein
LAFAAGGFIPLPMAAIPGLRSPYDEVGGIVHFGRMLDKIRLMAKGGLPPDYVEAAGVEAGGFDARCLRFLKLDYEQLKQQVNAGGFENGRKPTDDEIEIWNGFMTRRGWRDKTRARVIFRCEEAGMSPDGVETMFDFIDLDEGRPQRKFD